MYYTVCCRVTTKCLCLEELENNRLVIMRASLFKKEVPGNYSGHKIKYDDRIKNEKSRSGIDLSRPDPYTL